MKLTRCYETNPKQSARRECTLVNDPSQSFTVACYGCIHPGKRFLIKHGITTKNESWEIDRFRLQILNISTHFHTYCS